MESMRVGIDLDDCEEVENFMREYLSECRKYPGAKNACLKLIKDIEFGLFESFTTKKAGRVLVYDVEFGNHLEAFGTIGSMSYPYELPYPNVFLKNKVSDPWLAAKMHIYHETKELFPAFKNDEAAEELANLLGIPLELRIRVN